MWLHLNLCFKYFDEIQAKTKPFEYRLYNEYWQKRLIDRDYKGIAIKRGYPKANDKKSVLFRKYRGYEIQTITHIHFGPDPVKVFAIYVN